MKLVAKYTFVLVAALGLAITGLGYYHVERDQRHFEDDMRTDHRVVGHVLQALLTEIWQDVTASDGAKIERTKHVLDLANAGGGTTRFEWRPGPGDRERQEMEAHELVSQFPVLSYNVHSGSVLVRESLDDSDRALQADITYTLVSFAVIVLLCLIASLTLGGFFVGQPIHKLVDKARRVGRRDFAGAVDVRRNDELGELAAEMNAMSDALSTALTQIAKATDARIQAVEQLRHAERLATVGRLAAGIAHELGTPLSIVSGHAQMIAKREVSGDLVTDSATAIDREADRMGRIVRQLLDFARRKGPAGTACDPAVVAERCLMLLGPMAQHHNVKTEVAAPNRALRAVIDEDSLQHVITNLVVNAVQAMPSGGTLRVRLSHDADRVRIDVADTGTGVAPDALPHIFEPFFTTKPPGEGTGLGLAVVYGIVDDHHGSISVDTSPRGTTISVFLAEAA